MRLILVILGALIITGCYSKVIPPDSTKSETVKSELIVDEPFEVVWAGLIDYSASTFFSIDNFEKDSGLITLSFDAEDPDDVVDCGTKESPNMTVVRSFDNEGNPKFTGRMNIVVSEIGPNKTRVKLRARYVFSYKNPVDNETWVFETGTSDTHQFGVWTLTCQPTYKAETTILDGISQQFGR